MGRISAESNREILKIGPPAGQREAGEPMLMFLQLESGRNPAREPDFRKPDFRSPGGETGTRQIFSQFKSFGSSAKQIDSGPESFGIVVCRFVGTAEYAVKFLCAGHPYRNADPKTGRTSDRKPSENEDEPAKTTEIQRPSKRTFRPASGRPEGRFCGFPD